jgi:hypothetical protein
MALAMAAIVTGCNQNNELGTPAPSGEEDVLNVVATANDFVSSDATSRVSETDYTTTFEEGDAIGVFVVRDGEALISNMKMTLGADRTTWAGIENDNHYVAEYSKFLHSTFDEEFFISITRVPNIDISAILDKAVSINLLDKKNYYLNKI